MQEMMESREDILKTSVASLIEKIESNTRWYIKRYENTKDFKDRIIYEEKESKDCFERGQFSTIKGNVLLQEGIEELWKLAATTGGTQWNTTNGHLGVGTSTTAAANTDTGLLAGAVYADVTSVTINGTGNTTCNWVASFASGVANQAWQEYSLSNTSLDTGKNLNRKVSSQGTKQSGQVWELTLSISLS
jgi:hypothetical protein